MRTIEQDVPDIQGIILRGYQKLDAALYVLLRVEDAPRARAWVGQLAQQVRYGGGDPETTSVNVAFTAPGLRALGLDGIVTAAGEPATRQFSAAFQSGMTSAHRQRLLGDNDRNQSHPDHWEWGGHNNPAVHVLVLLYTKTSAELLPFYRNVLVPGFAAGGLHEIVTLTSRKLADDKEHFGFRDGISNTPIAGLSTKPDAVQPGEFLLGYKNEYGVYAERPVLDAARDPAAILPEDEEHAGRRDFGRNGSYLVFRQLEQDVFRFWNTLNDKCAGDRQRREMLAAKMVGRWPGGAPLVLAPDQDDPALADANGFTYFQADPDGLKCPLGAHIRRTNPRDSLDPTPGSKDSLAVNKRHRILRRGRPYGEPIVEPIDPQAVLDHGPDDKPRGMLFMCFNANLTRQFEFIQESWLNNPKFVGLTNDTDPLVGDRSRTEDAEHTTFTVPANPVRVRVQGLPQFVRARGGAYFFMPGRRALQYLASL